MSSISLRGALKTLFAIDRAEKNLDRGISQRPPAFGGVESEECLRGSFGYRFFRNGELMDTHLSGLNVGLLTSEQSLT
jgi:hypothetical protein